jgi:hypothetical protein
MEDLLRHTVATLAYRGGKAVRGAPAEFADYLPMPGGRTPVQILAHIGDLFDWAIGLADGKHAWNNAPPLPWDQEVARFFSRLETFDQRLSNGEPLGTSAQKLFQGPIADALTHVGQLTMLRRMAGCKMRGENYFKADIATGCVGTQQAAPIAEFDK